jgi:iron complex outermembrane receptor protein
VKTSRGFKGGTLQQRAPDIAAAKPEFATDYEVGLKSELFDHRLRVNLDGYVTYYTNKQESESLVNAEGTLEDFVVNAATARITGFEGDFQANPVAGWTIYGTVSYLDGVFTDFPNAVYPFPCAGSCPYPANAAGQKFDEPPWQYSLGSRYDHDLGPGRAALELDWTWRDALPRTNLNFDPLVPAALDSQFREAVGLLNGRLDYTLPKQQLTFSLFATNMLNKHYQVNALDLLSAFGFVTGFTQPPAMYGLQIKKTFGPGD